MVTETQQGLPVKQDYRLHRVAGDIQQGYWFRELPAPECCRFRSVAGSGVLPVTEESVPILTGKEPASNSVLTTGSTVSLLSEPTGLTGYRACLIAEKSC